MVAPGNRSSKTEDRSSGSITVNSSRCQLEHGKLLPYLVSLLRGKTPKACLTKLSGLSQNEAECRVEIKRNICPYCHSRNAIPSLNVF